MDMKEWSLMRHIARCCSDDRTAAMTTFTSTRSLRGILFAFEVTKRSWCETYRTYRHYMTQSNTCILCCWHAIYNHNKNTNAADSEAFVESMPSSSSGASGAGAALGSRSSSTPRARFGAAGARGAEPPASDVSHVVAGVAERSSGPPVALRRSVRIAGRRTGGTAATGVPSPSSLHQLSPGEDHAVPPLDMELLIFSDHLNVVYSRQFLIMLPILILCRLLSWRPLLGDVLYCWSASILKTGYTSSKV